MAIQKLSVPVVVVCVLLMLTLVLTRPAPFANAAFQNTQSRSDNALSAGLLRRLAEAADGYRTGQPIWVVARTQEPYDILGVFSDSAAAARAKESVAGADRFGPFVTPLDFNRAMALVPVRHRPPTIYGGPGDSLAAWKFPAQPIPIDDLDSIAISAYNRRGLVVWHASSPARDIDAVFFTLAAQDKFAFPYYARVSGLEQTEAMRNDVANFIRRGH